MSEVVYSYSHGEIFTLKVIGRNEGRYAAYCKRIGVEMDSDASNVDESTPAGTRNEKPSFYETRYFLRCDFKDPSVKDAVFFHKMASVSEAFDFDGKTSPCWLCPNHPANRKLEMDAMLELALEKDVDGIHYDYFRYADFSSKWCFCA